MSDELAAKYVDSLADLSELRKNAPSLAICSRFQRLERLVLIQLGIDSVLSDSCRANVLMWLLPSFVDYVRKRALRDLVLGAPRGSNPVFLAAAATEILKIRPPGFDEQYDRLRKELKKSPLEKIPGGNSGSIAAAAAWIGLTKRAVDVKKQAALLKAFVLELDGRLLDPEVRDYLSKLINRQAQRSANSQAASVRRAVLSESLTKQLDELLR